MERPAGYDTFIKSSQWRNICKIKKKQAGMKCERCGCGSAHLDVHHLTYDRFGGKEKPEDLLVVCTSCHVNEERKRQLELKKKAQKALYDARFEGYIKAVHGEYYLLTEVPTDEDYDAFEAYIEKKDNEEG